MNKISRGKSKIVLDPCDGTNEVILQFTGDQTCDENGNLDPGANFVMENVSDEEKRKIATSVIGMSEHFFRLLEANSVPTHFISSDIDALQMRVRRGVPLGQGIELIQRYFAFGSFSKRFKGYAAAEKWRPIDLQEFHHKNDEQGDPPMSLETILALDILTEDEYYVLSDLLETSCEIIRADLAGRGLTLIDIKLEAFRATDDDGNTYFMIGDEIAGGSMRVALDGIEIKDKLLLSHLILNYDLVRFTNEKEG